jgi:hypothetical protein
MALTLQSDSRQGTQFVLPFAPSKKPRIVSVPEQLPSHGLIIREPWLSLILNGQKTWEIRGSNTSRRGRIGLIRSRSLAVIGECVVVDSIGPLHLNDLMSSGEKHLMSQESLIQSGIPYNKTFAWVLADPVFYDQPRPYKHNSGAVIWVRLT